MRALLIVAGAVIVLSAGWFLADRYAAWAPDDEWVAVPAPAPPRGPVALRVVHAVNPRLPQFTPAQIDLLLATASQTAERHLGVRVSLHLVEVVRIDELFEGVSPVVWRRARQQIYEPRDGASADERLYRATFAALRAHGMSAELARGYLAPHVDLGRGGDLESITAHLVQLLRERLAAWRRVRAGDGLPLIRDEPYHQWMAWVALGYAQLPYDVVLTNQLIASAEYSGAEIHSLVRGGVPMGATFFSRSSSRGAYVMASTFMFSDALAEVVRLRADGRYSETEAARLAGAYMAHELGHLLLRLGHPYDNKACVMRPAVMFQFREWLEALDAESCPVGSHPEMRVGTVRLAYNRGLLAH